MTRVLLTILFLLPSCLAFQKKTEPENDPPSRFVSRSSLILIPTVVTTKQGDHIKGLKREDFGVLEDGQRKELKIFEEIQSSKLHLRQQDQLNGIYSNELADGPGGQRSTVMVFDLLNTRFEDQARGRRELLRFLQETLQPDEPLALMTLGPHGLEMINDFSTDPKALASAVQRVRNQPAVRDNALAADTARETSSRALRWRIVRVQLLVSGRNRQTRCG